MPRKGLRSIFFHPSPPHAHSRRTTLLLSVETFRATLMEDNIAAAADLVAKWDPDVSPFARITSLFHHSRAEARRFLLAAHDLHQAMRFFTSSSTDGNLARAQRLMKTAMARLRRELHQILAANRDRLDSDSVSSARTSLSLSTATSPYSSSLPSDFDDDCLSAVEEALAAGEAAPPTLVMLDLRAIAQCMISCGYSLECVASYAPVRREIVDDGLARLGFHRLSPKEVRRLDWDSLEKHIRSWHEASEPAVRTIFTGERALCDFVFGSSGDIRDSCFAEIAGDAAVQFLGFPELAALSTAKRSRDKIFRFLDMYSAVAKLSPAIDDLFSSAGTAAVISQVQFTQRKLGECVRAAVDDFDSALRKEHSKDAAAGGGVHPLAESTMDYLVRLAGYTPALIEIYADLPMTAPPSPLPEPFHGLIHLSAPNSPCYSTVAEEEPYVDAAPFVSSRFAWLLLALLCKLDYKADLYGDRRLAYLFLANNLSYVLSRVRRSGLAGILGREWAASQERKVRSFLRSYERLAWGKVVESIPENPEALLEQPDGVAAARECMRRFNVEFEEAFRRQAGWVVVEGRMGRELGMSIAMKVVGPYRSFYEQCRAPLRADRDSIGVIRFAPEDVGGYLADLFADDYSSSASPISFVSGSSAKRSPWRRLVLRLRRK